MPKDDYAFPRKSFGWAPGMELRDWFAGMAMQGILAGRTGWVDYDRVTLESYAYADAMIEHRSKEQNND